MICVRFNSPSAEYVLIQVLCVQTWGGFGCRKHGNSIMKAHLCKNFCRFLFLIVALLLCSSWVSHGYLQNKRICVLSLTEDRKVDQHSMGDGLMVTD